MKQNSLFLIRVACEFGYQKIKSFYGIRFKQKNMSKTMLKSQMIFLVTITYFIEKTAMLVLLILRLKVVVILIKGILVVR
ncbi:hypothetical protein SDC9_198969 [bioreactor metagenome]|uniref:Uncharacterized protein n=1 Tax=bioreactor metagenome TaxID=1076179 RepID=A0A645IK07_9ZZZZ